MRLVYSYCYKIPKTAVEVAQELRERSELVPLTAVTDEINTLTTSDV